MVSLFYSKKQWYVTKNQITYIYTNTTFATLIIVQNCDALPQIFHLLQDYQSKEAFVIKQQIYVAIYESEREPFIFPDLNNFSLLINFSCLPLRRKIAEGYSNRDSGEILLHAYIAKLLHNCVAFEYKIHYFFVWTISNFFIEKLFWTLTYIRMYKFIRFFSWYLFCKIL